MLRTNEKQLVKVSVTGEISHPTLARSKYNIGSDGTLRVLPGVGGITYNVRVGDCAVGLAADHVEPGASVRKPRRSDARENDALNVLACVGNEARLVSGDAKGDRGVVTGKHGGIEHVIIDFPPATLEKAVVGDRVQIVAFGVGLELADYPGVKVMNCDPRLLKAMKLKEMPDGRLEAPVAHVIPAKIMGSGLGASSCYSGDYDVQLFDEKTVAEYGLDKLRFGDVVAISDADHSYGRIYKKGATSIGVIVHSDSDVSGHGPGVTTLMTSARGDIVTRVTQSANLATLLSLRSKKKKKAGKKPAKKK